MTNQALPPAIQRQLDEAAAIEKQLFSTPAPEGNTETEAVADPAPAEPVAVETPVVQPESVAQKSEEDTYRRRYEVLQGKFDAEVPRLHAQLRDATARLEQAFDEIKTLRETKASEPVATAPDTDAETFGEDLTAVIDRRATNMAKTMVKAEVAPILDYVRKLEAQLGNVNEQVAETAQDRFLTNLRGIVPDYEAVNADQGFLNWLGDVDPVYGVPRQVALDAAANRLDAAQVANVFNAYKMLTGKQQKNQQQKDTRQELERQVAPNAPRGSSADAATATGKLWTAADYSRAFDPRTIRELGATKAAELMAEADRASAEGRVQW